MNALPRRSSFRRRVPFGCEPLEARLQFAGDLTFDGSFSPDLQSALDHAIIARGNTTAHLESSGLGLVLDLTGSAGTLLSVAADGIPAAITGVKVLDASQFSISGTRAFAFLNLDTVAQAKVTGIQVQYSLYANNVTQLQADASQAPVTLAGSKAAIFYSTSFDHATVLSSAINLTLAAPAGVNALSLVLLEPEARVRVGFDTSDLTIYGGAATQVEQVSLHRDYTPPSFVKLTAPPDPVTPPTLVQPPASVVVPPVSTPVTPVAVSDPVVSTPPIVVVPDPPVVTAPPPVAAAPPPVVSIPPPVVTAPPAAAAPPAVVSAPPPVVAEAPPAPPALSPAGEAAVPEFLRALVYLASLNLISFDDPTRTHIGLLLGRAGVVGVSDAVTIKTTSIALDSFDHRRGVEPFLRGPSASRHPALADGPLPLPPLPLTSRTAGERPPGFFSLAAADRGGERGAGDPVPPAERARRFPVPPPSGAEEAGPRPRLFPGEASPAASFAEAAASLPTAPLQALGNLLADHLQAEFTPGERAAVLISEARRAGSSLHY